LGKIIQAGKDLIFSSGESDSKLEEPLEPYVSVHDEHSPNPDEYQSVREDMAHDESGAQGESLTDKFANLGAKVKKLIVGSDEKRPETSKDMKKEDKKTVTQ